MAIPAELAKQIAESKTSDSGNRIRDGRYTLEVTRIFCDKMYTGYMFIGEFIVRKASPTSKDVEPNAVGSTCSVAYNLTAAGKAGSAAASNTKKLVKAVLNMGDATDEEVGEAIKEICESDNPARGILVDCETVRSLIQTGKAAGTEGVFPRFMAVAQNEAEVKARRKAQELK